MSGFTVCRGRPFKRAWPEPVRTSATATAVFLRPKHCTFSAALVSAIVREDRREECVAAATLLVVPLSPNGYGL
eukprot:CAMPEP_0177338084 /NCGR_PEP_ID=MMETSP0368-20130122/24669_1 /TAXON_ID=447022 ORGANISM="Scrippsiella hangoei-like, Strain SHHI-4" /NCGR_SAMPLE_ID=MMETSP0368 /ASSEMBLY_ACC=CAM_ASM_000363 /LENGTH=73 /DNA_ID=CAMNT_0018799057 /DNA_START=76 /DNA_END=294 /DNA_ORIENTATION=+